MPLIIMAQPTKIVMPIPPMKGINRVQKPARMSRILKKIDHPTVRWAKSEMGVAAPLIVESSKRCRLRGPRLRRFLKSRIVR
jgi:hypothetical protein